MKVQGYSKFRKKGKNEISKFHVDWKISPSQGRGKVQKIGEEILKGPFSKFLIPGAHLFGLM